MTTPDPSTTPDTSKCPHASSRPGQTDYTYVFKEISDENFFSRFGSTLAEWLSRISFQSFRNLWIVAKTKNIHKMFSVTWKKEDMISKCRTLLGTVYITANIDIMKVIFQNPRANDQGLFWDKENKRIFIKGVLVDLYPEEIHKLGVDEAAKKMIFSTDYRNSKKLRSPLMNVLGAGAIKEHTPDLNKIADDFFESLSEQEKMHCDYNTLAFEFSITIAAKFLGYHTTRENYLALDDAIRMFNIRVKNIVFRKAFNDEDQKKYQEAIMTTKTFIESCISASNPAEIIVKMKESGLDDMEMRLNLFFVFYDAAATMGETISYLLSELSQVKNRHFLEKLRDPVGGADFLSQVVAETLRLHPTGFVPGRQFRKNTFFEAYNSSGKLVKRIKLLREHTVLCMTPLAAIDPEKFENPLEFNPERFTGGNPRTQLSWYPFGSGMHICPGQYFALGELQIFILRLINKFNIEWIEPDTANAAPTHMKLIDRQK